MACELLETFTHTSGGLGLVPSFLDGKAVFENGITSYIISQTGVVRLKKNPDSSSPQPTRRPIIKGDPSLRSDDLIKVIKDLKWNLIK